MPKKPPYVMVGARLVDTPAKGASTAGGIASRYATTARGCVKSATGTKMLTATRTAPFTNARQRRSPIDTMETQTKELATYRPEMWTVAKDDIYHALDALKAGLDHARENLTRHDSELGRTTRKNEMWAKQIERDIKGMELVIDRLRRYSALTMPAPTTELPLDAPPATPRVRAL